MNQQESEYWLKCFMELRNPIYDTHKSDGLIEVLKFFKVIFL